MSSLSHFQPNRQNGESIAATTVPANLPAAEGAVTSRSRQRQKSRNAPWLVPAVIAAAGALALWPYYPDGSSIAFLGLFSCFFAFAVGVAVNNQYPALPQFGAALFGVQHVLCPMFYKANSGLITAFEITPYFDETFRLSSWAAFIFTFTVLGLTLSVPAQRGIETFQKKLREKTRRDLLQWSWYVWTATTLFSFTMRHLPIPALAYVWALFLMLQVVSMGTLIFLLPEKQVKYYFAAVLAVHIAMALDTAFFSHMVIGSGVAVILLAHRYMWRWKLVALILGAVILGSAVQAHKDAYREMIWHRGGAYSMVDRLDYWENNISGHLREFSWGVNFAWPLIERLNQGKIVERVVAVVPEKENPARGETIIQAFKLVIPRFIWKEKPVYYSLEMFEKYTHHQLQPGTSMGVGPLGESYLNYGDWALLAFFFYSLSIGLISRLWVRLGAAFPLWWAWYYYVMSYWMKFESDFAKAINATIKSAFVLAVIIAVFVVWQKALGFKKERAARPRRNRVMPPGNNNYRLKKPL